MNIKVNWAWGFFGFLGFLGYILQEPLYYVFFVFFMFFLSINQSKGPNNILKEPNNFYEITYWLGAVALILSGIVLMITKTMTDLISIILLLGIMAFITNFFSYIGMEKPKDERLRKIGTTSATWSWYITVSFVSFLLITSYWAGRERSGTELLGVTILVMVASLAIINSYLKWKGDIE